MEYIKFYYFITVTFQLQLNFIIIDHIISAFIKWKTKDIFVYLDNINIQWIQSKFFFQCLVYKIYFIKYVTIYKIHYRYI